MKNTKEFTVTVEREFKVSLDMDKYSPETLQQVNDYFGHFNGDFLSEYGENDSMDDYYEDEILEKFLEDIVQQHIKGYDVSDLEGFAVDAQKCAENGYPHFRVNEVK